MLKRCLLTLVVLFCALGAWAQMGAIRGTVIDKSGEPVPFANVAAYRNGNLVSGTSTDFDGNYIIKPLSPGKYDVEVTHMEFAASRVVGIGVSPDKTTMDINFSMNTASHELTGVEIVHFKEKLIEKDGGTSGGEFTRDELKNMTARNVNQFAAAAGGGSFSQDNGTDDVSIKGSRNSSTVVFIDGVKVRGSQGLPKSALESVSVLTGGVPAQYGDATGGVINITTRGASKEWFGGLELRSSGAKFGDNDPIGLDQFATNLLGFSFGGPLITVKDSTGKVLDAKMSFFLSGELTSDVDPFPSVLGSWRLTDSSRAKLEANPLLAEGTAAEGTQFQGELLRKNDFEQTKYYQNAARKGINLNGKVVYNTSSTTDLTFGGSLVYNNHSNPASNPTYMLFNSDNYGQNINSTIRGYARFNKRFGNDKADGTKKKIQNTYITLQASYTREQNLWQSAQHKDNFTHYGYVGKFTQLRTPQYEYQEDVLLADGQYHDGLFFTGDEADGLLFERSEINPILANYTDNYYDIYGYAKDQTYIESTGGLYNGGTPFPIYGVFSNVGTPYSTFQKNTNEQFVLSAIFSGDVKKHAISYGVEYDQRIDRSYALNPIGLWRTAATAMNSHISQIDSSNYTIENYGSTEIITFGYLYDEASQTYFDKKVREKLGLPVDGTSWIDINSYDADVFSISDFSADQLLFPGQVNYFGYDHTGEKIKGTPSLEDYFNQTGSEGEYLRYVPSLKPNYFAFWIQDKFEFNDLILRAGLRIDRFDANQPVLKDPYVLFPTVKAGEIDAERPSNIGDDFVVYVNDVESPSVDGILGYRDPNTNIWYNSEGTQLENPNAVLVGGRAMPWLVDPENRNPQTDLTSNAFESYKARVNVMPRISFSFPISDEALFYAYYDVLTERPKTNLGFNPIDYQYILTRNTQLNNPNLGTPKTKNFELGYQQKIGNSSSLKIATYYKKEQDQIQITKRVGAFPIDYTTYDNLDFSTVKGLNLTYAKRRTGNIALTANYTLQFAEGTGSNQNSALAIINAGKPNLKTIFPLNNDRRHTLSMLLDYRYAKGKGPLFWNHPYLENAGVSLTLIAGSGTPYSRSNRADPLPGNNNLIGTVNGSRLPWSFSVNTKFDKRWDIETKNPDKPISLDLYLDVDNLLNLKNLVNVYAYTGTPDDDGYLASALGQQSTQQKTDPQSYIDIYSIALQNPAFYLLPRRMRLGLTLDF